MPTNKIDKYDVNLTAADVGALPLYTSLASLGLSDDNMLDTYDGLVDNLEQIVNALPNYGQAILKGSSGNFITSVCTRINTDLGTDLTGIALHIRKFGGTVSPVTIDAAGDTSSTRNRIFTTVFDNTSAGSKTLQKFSASYNAEGFLPLTGGTLSGSLRVDKSNGTQGFGEFYKNNSESADYGTAIKDFDNEGNDVSLDIKAKDNKITFKPVGGTAGQLYGEHNHPITDLTAKGAAPADSTLATSNTVRFHVQQMLNRTSTVNSADTGYTSYKARGIAFVTSAPSSLTNGCCAFVYE